MSATSSSGDFPSATWTTLCFPKKNFVSSLNLRARALNGPVLIFSKDTTYAYLYSFIASWTFSNNYSLAPLSLVLTFVRGTTLARFDFGILI